MAGIHRERPGADAMSGATGDPAVGIGEQVWMSPGRGRPTVPKA